MNTNNRMNQPHRSRVSSYSRYVQSNQQQHTTARRPVAVARIPLSREYRHLLNSDEKDSNFEICRKPDLSTTQMSDASTALITDTLAEVSDVCGMSSSLSCSSVESTLGISTNHRRSSGNWSPVLSSNALTGTEQNGLFSECSSLQNNLRISPVHFPSSPPMLTRNHLLDDKSRSGSPPCKRRKVSTHHTLRDSPPRWEGRRSQRSSSNKHSRPDIKKTRCTTRSSRNPYQLSPPHTFAYHTLRSSPPTSPLQPAMMLDVTQVPITVPVSLYAGPHLTVCQGNTPLTSTHVHSVHGGHPHPYSHPQISSLYPNYGTSHRQHHATASAGIPTFHHGYTSHHQNHNVGHGNAYISSSPPFVPHYHSPPRTPENILRVSSPPLLPFSSDNRTSQMDQLRNSSVVRASQRRWRYPVTSTSTLPNVFQFIAMLPLPLESRSLDSEVENYDALLQVAATLSEEAPRGLNRFEINQIPCFKFETSKNRGEQTSCVVCMCDFEDKETLRHLPCSHKFHAKCVDKWLKTNRTCPICRGDATRYPSPSE